MALTKTEAAKLTNDMMLRGVIETIIKESPILQLLPFMQVVGTALTYNRENAMATAAFYDPGDEWAESVGSFTQVTAALKIMGGDADVDNFLQQTYADPNDLEAVIIEGKAKAVAHLFSTTFFNGNDASEGGNPKSFDGLVNAIPAGQTLSMGDDGGSLDEDKLDELIDLVKPGRPDVLLMHKRTRRKLSALRRATGYMLETSVNQFGQHVVAWDGIPILTDDFISITETEGEGTALSSIFALKFGADGVMGIENGGIQVEEVGELETKDATRWRVKWYAAIALFSELGVARLKGITAA